MLDMILLLLTIAYISIGTALASVTAWYNREQGFLVVMTCWFPAIVAGVVVVYRR